MVGEDGCFGCKRSLPLSEQRSKEVVLPVLDEAVRRVFGAAPVQLDDCIEHLVIGGRTTHGIGAPNHVEGFEPCGAFVQVQTDFRVRYDDIDGVKILEADWTEPWEPAFHLQPGQTIYRTGYAFDGVTFARPIRGEQVSAGSIAEVFSRLETCAVVEEPEATVATTEPFIAQDWVPQLDLVDCGANPETGRYEGTALIGNPTELPLRVLEVGFEILDASGTRLGMGGSDGAVSIEPGGTGEISLWSVLYTIADVDDAQSCGLVSLRVDQ